MTSSRSGLAGVLGALLLASSVSAAAADSFIVVVNTSVSGASVRRADLAAVFLKKATRWGNGVPATPVDQSGTSSVREAFSGVVLQMPVNAVVQYWQRQLLSSATLAVLPAVRASDEEVLAYVARTKGAVAYVSPESSLPAGVKALSILD